MDVSLVGDWLAGIDSSSVEEQNRIFSLEQRKLYDLIPTYVPLDIDPVTVWKKTGKDEYLVCGKYVGPHRIDGRVVGLQYEPLASDEAKMVSQNIRGLTKESRLEFLTE